MTALLARSATLTATIAAAAVLSAAVGIEGFVQPSPPTRRSAGVATVGAAPGSARDGKICSLNSRRSGAPSFPSLRRRQRVPRRAAPERHIRLRPRSARGRADRSRTFDVQTAVTTYTRTLPSGDVATVDLHAQIHVGERGYYEYYSDPEEFGRYDRVLYELVVGENLLMPAGGRDGGRGKGRRVLQPATDGGNPLAAAPADVSMARGYGLACQVDSINYAQKGWVHADYTREELVRLAAEMREEERGPDVSGVGYGDGRPIWALASSPLALSFPLPSSFAEFVSALLRPLSPSTPPGSPVTRRLFSNLFLPGDGLAALIRAGLWLAVPCPEASVILLDWSSLSPRPTGGISPVALPALGCLLSGNLVEARRLVFGQMVVSGQSLAERGSRSSSSADVGNVAAEVLLNRRNDMAAEVLHASVEEDGSRSCALLYGGTHCHGLDTRLRNMGFIPRKTEWRTAWTVRVPALGLGFVSGGSGSVHTTGDRNSFMSAFAGTATPDGLAVALLAVPLYLTVGGFDWVATVRDVGVSLGGGQLADAVLELALYLVRHVALYLGLSKFVVEWDGMGLFGGGADGGGVDR